MTSAAAIGLNTILKKGDGGSPEAFTDYGLEVTSVSGVGFSRAPINATHMQSANGYEEFIFGIKTNKPFTVEVNWVPSNTGAYQTLMEGSQGNWQFLFPNGSSVTVTAGINDVAIGALTPDGKMSATFSFTPSGKPTWA